MKRNRVYSFCILIILLIILTIMSFFQYENQKDLKDTGVRVEGQLASIRRTMNSGRSIFRPMFKYQATYVFTAIDSERYGVMYTTKDKNTISDKKIIYYNPHKFSQYTFEDNKPFGWVKEIFITWIKGLAFALLLINFLSYINIGE